MNEVRMPTERPRAVGREIGLLPRHWDWLARQPRSPGATLRALVDEARRDRDGRLSRRDAQEACYRHMRLEAGDRPGFEAAVRALFAANEAAFGSIVAAWPADVAARCHALAACVWVAPAMAQEERHV